MVTIRVNIVALITAITIAWISVLGLKQAGFTYVQMLQVAIPVFAAIRAYDYIAALNAFKGGNKNKKDGKQ